MCVTLKRGIDPVTAILAVLAGVAVLALLCVVLAAVWLPRQSIPARLVASGESLMRGMSVPRMKATMKSWDRFLSVKHEAGGVTTYRWWWQFQDMEASVDATVRQGRVNRVRISRWKADTPTYESVR